MPEPRSLYSEAILDHIKNARNYYELPDANRSARGVNPLCGDSFSVYLRTEADYISQASFQCECCGISMASASIMTEAVRGKSLAEAKALVLRFEELMRAPDAIAQASRLGRRFPA